MDLELGDRIGPYLVLVDGDGCRHLVHCRSVQSIHDADPLRSDTIIVAAGRTITIPRPLEEIVGWLGAR